MIDREDFLNTSDWDEIKFCLLVTQINLSHSLLFIDINDNGVVSRMLILLVQSFLRTNEIY